MAEVQKSPTLPPPPSKPRYSMKANSQLHAPCRFIPGETTLTINLIWCWVNLKTSQNAVVKENICRLPGNRMLIIQPVAQSLWGSKAYSSVSSAVFSIKDRAICCYQNALNSHSRSTWLSSWSRGQLFWSDAIPGTVRPTETQTTAASFLVLPNSSFLWLSHSTIIYVIEKQP